jgi:hypothetical protein
MISIILKNSTTGEIQHVTRKLNDFIVEDLENFYPRETDIEGHLRTRVISTDKGNVFILSPIDRNCGEWTQTCNKLFVDNNRHMFFKYESKLIYLTPVEYMCLTYNTNGLKTLLDSGGKLTDLAIEIIFSENSKFIKFQVKEILEIISDNSELTNKYIITPDLVNSITNIYLLNFMANYCTFESDLSPVEIYNSLYQMLYQKPIPSLQTQMNSLELSILYDLWLVEINMTPLTKGDISSYIKLATRIQLFLEFIKAKYTVDEDIAEDYEEEIRFEFVKSIVYTDQDLLDALYANDYSYLGEFSESNPYIKKDSYKDILTLRKFIINWNDMNDMLIDESGVDPLA